MIRYLILLTLLTLVQPGCMSPEPQPIPRDEACHEQADAWCTRAGFGGAPGCWVWYVHECEPSGPDGLIEAEAQEHCLNAIEQSRTPDREPAACVATWTGP